MESKAHTKQKAAGKTAAKHREVWTDKAQRELDRQIWRDESQKNLGFVQRKILNVGGARNYLSYLSVTLFCISFCSNEIALKLKADTFSRQESSVNNFGKESNE
jgi:hypothetical protein